NGELDAGLVDKFIRCLGVYPVGSLVTLTTNKLGIVAHSNNDAPTKPMVTTFFDLENNHFIHAEQIDLSNDADAKIIECVMPDDYNLDIVTITEYLMRQG
ncbi:MAG: HD-GYP domain-containing protein, partial [Gammaproteobacteria bacterium]|nr:HD-GYP domain-containing protein [Gammaproteobacteria bacterium]